MSGRFIDRELSLSTLTLLAVASGSLIISGLFGFAQVVAGFALARRLAHGQQWMEQSHVLSAIAGVWLMTSGLAEIVVTLANVIAGTNEGPVATIRSIADAILLIVTLLLILALAGFFLLRKQLTAQDE